jgi:C4-dicarboxylate transporter
VLNNPWQVGSSQASHAIVFTGGFDFSGVLMGNSLAGVVGGTGAIAALAFCVLPPPAAAEDELPELLLPQAATSAAQPSSAVRMTGTRHFASRRMCLSFCRSAEI